MTNDKFEDGGPAFPFEYQGYLNGRLGCGMTLWDYYAAHAPVHRGWNSEKNAAECCAAFADAIMEERKKRGLMIAL
jgi:hypothetical protein